MMEITRKALSRSRKTDGDNEPHHKNTDTRNPRTHDVTYEYSKEMCDFLLDISTQCTTLKPENMVKKLEGLANKISPSELTRCWYVLFVYLEVKMSYTMMPLEKHQQIILQYRLTVGEVFPSKTLWNSYQKSVIWVAKNISTFCLLEKALTKSLENFHTLFMSLKDKETFTKHNCDVYEICIKILNHRKYFEEIQQEVSLTQKIRKKCHYGEGGWLSSSKEKEPNPRMAEYNKAAQQISSLKNESVFSIKYKDVYLDLKTIKTNDHKYSWDNENFKRII